MNGKVLMGFALLLVWAPGSQASLNSARPDASQGERLAVTCNTQAVEHADWGDIMAVVQSTRLCLQRGGWRQGFERTPVYRNVGLAQRGDARLTGALAGQPRR